MQQSLTKGLGEGAMMAALTVVFALAGIYIPILNILTMLIIAVPITLVIVRNSFKIGVISSLVAAFLIAALAGPIMAVTFYIQFMSIALIYGYLFKNKAKAGKIIITGTAVAVLSTFLLLTISLAIINVDFDNQQEMVLETVDDMFVLYEEQGLLEKIEEQGVSREEFRENMINSVKLAFSILPAILIIVSSFSAIINFVIARNVLRRFGHEIEKLPAFKDWSLPWYAVWGVILGWAAYLLGDYFDLSAGVVLGRNILIVFAFALLIQGLALWAFIFEKFKTSGFAKIAIVIFLILFLRFIVTMAVIIGLFDLVLDYRKMIKDREKRKKEK